MTPGEKRSLEQQYEAKRFEWSVLNAELADLEVQLGHRAVGEVVEVPDNVIPFPVRPHDDAA